MTKRTLGLFLLSGRNNHLLQSKATRNRLTDTLRVITQVAWDIFQNVGGRETVSHHLTLQTKDNNVTGDLSRESAGAQDFRVGDPACIGQGDARASK